MADRHETVVPTPEELSSWVMWTWHADSDWAHPFRFRDGRWQGLIWSCEPGDRVPGMLMCGADPMTWLPALREVAEMAMSKDIIEQPTWFVEHYESLVGGVGW